MCRLATASCGSRLMWAHQRTIQHTTSKGNVCVLASPAAEVTPDFLSLPQKENMCCHALHRTNAELTQSVTINHYDNFRSQVPTMWPDGSLTSSGVRPSQVSVTCASLLPSLLTTVTELLPQRKSITDMYKYVPWDNLSGLILIRHPYFG